MATHPVYRKFVDTELIYAGLDEETRELAIQVMNLKNTGPVKKIFYYIKDDGITQSFLDERNYNNTLEKFRGELYESANENDTEKLKPSWAQTQIAKTVSPVTLNAIQRITHEFSDGLRERSVEEIKKIVEEISYMHLGQEPYVWKDNRDIKNLAKAGWKLE